MLSSTALRIIDLMMKEDVGLALIMKYSKYGVYKGQDIEKVFFLMDQYLEYKMKYVENIRFDPGPENLSMNIKSVHNY